MATKQIHQKPKCLKHHLQAFAHKFYESYSPTQHSTATAKDYYMNETLSLCKHQNRGCKCSYNAINNSPTAYCRCRCRCSWLHHYHQHIGFKYAFRIDFEFMMKAMFLIAIIMVSGHAVIAAQQSSLQTQYIDNGHFMANSKVVGSQRDRNTANALNVTRSWSGSSSTATTIKSNYTQQQAMPRMLRTVEVTTTIATITAKATTTTTTIPITATTKIARESNNFSPSKSMSASYTSLSQSGINWNSIQLLDAARKRGGEPYFDVAASKNVTALLGKTAYLNCRVKNLGNKTMLLQVSWVRHRDIHLLTVGRYTYTSDQRFRAIHQPQTEDWVLQIKYPQHRDSGIYECQVSTTPHLSHYVHLSVIEPSTQIIGAPELYIESGSTINLTCVILNSPEPPAFVFWNHNEEILNYGAAQGRVSISTGIVNYERQSTASILLIRNAQSSDSGYYQCNPSAAKPRSVTVHVLNGEFPAAMQRAGQAHHSMSPAHYLLTYLTLHLLTWSFVKRYLQQPVQTVGAAGKIATYDKK